MIPDWMWDEADDEVFVVSEEGRKRAMTFLWGETAWDRRHELLDEPQNWDGLDHYPYWMDL